MLTAQRLDTLGNDSRVVAALWTLVTAPEVAWRGCALRRHVEPFTCLGLPLRIRAIGGVLAVAVGTHVLVLAALGVPVRVLGWSTRAVLVAVCIMMIRRPDPLATAWRLRMGAAPENDRA
jgi:hypothetical protein